MSDKNRVDLSIPANVRYLNIVGSTVASLMEHMTFSGDPEAIVYEVQLAIHEICTNIIEHAYNNDSSERVEMAIVIHPANTLIVNLYDRSGTVFDETDVADPDPESLQIRGFGLSLVRQIMDDVTYHHDNGKNYWVLTKKF